MSLSPPAVTRVVNELEARLHVRLLQRSTRALRVTDAGALFAQDCRRILADLADAEESACGVHTTPGGWLCVTAPVMLGERLVMPVLAEYQQQRPSVRVRSLFLDRVVNLTEEGVDVGVRVGELPDSSLQAVCVGQVECVRVASPAYLDRQGHPSDPQSLLEGHRVIANNGHWPTTEWSFRNHPTSGEIFSLRLLAHVVTSFDHAAARAALQGLGIASLMTYQVSDELADGRLQRVLPGNEPPPRPVHVVHRQGRYASSKARSFIDLAVERLRVSLATVPC